MRAATRPHGRDPAGRQDGLEARSASDEGGASEGEREKERERESAGVGDGTGGGVVVACVALVRERVLLGAGGDCAVACCASSRKSLLDSSPTRQHTASDADS